MISHDGERPRFSCGSQPAKQRIVTGGIQRRIGNVSNFQCPALDFRGLAVWIFAGGIFGAFPLSGIYTFLCIFHALVVDFNFLVFVQAFLELDSERQEKKKANRHQEDFFIGVYLKATPKNSIERRHSGILMSIDS